MGCCGPGFHTAVQPVGADITLEDLHGPLGNRSCRDVVFLIIFAIFLSGMAYVACSSFILGNPNKLIFGVDSWGNICGNLNHKIEGVPNSGRDNTRESNLFYFDQSVFTASAQGVLSDVRTISICVSVCPYVDITTDDELRNFSTSTGSKLCVYELPISNYSAGSNDALGDCPPLPINKQQSVLFRCIPKSVSNAIEVMTSTINNLLKLIDANFTEKCLKDLRNTWKEICYLSAIGLGVSLTLVILLRFIAVIIIWTMVILLSLGSVTATALCWFHYYTVKTNGEGEQIVMSWLIGSICATVITLVLLLILLVLRKYISLVIQLFEEAGRAMSSMPLLLIQPLWTLLVLLCVLLVVIYVFLCIESAGHPTINESTGFVKYREDNILKYLKWYHIIGSIWIFQFINACERISIAGAVAEWYFTKNRNNLSFPIMKSIGRLIRYHLGSAALGSLILTVIIVVRLLLSFVHNRLKAGSGAIIDFFLKCTKCCLWCFERFIQFLNSNAYIEIAILGCSFCKAARQAFQIIISNALRIAAINSVGDFTLFLGKMAAVAVVAVVGMEIMTNRSDVFYMWLPITLSCLVTYIISSSFLGIYEKYIQNNDSVNKS